MDLDDALDNFFYYGLIVWFIFVVYLGLGNGIMPLAFVEIVHPYQAVVHLPSWAILSVGLVFLMFGRVTTDKEEHEKIEAIVFLAIASIALIATVWGTLPTPSPWNYLFTLAAALTELFGVWNLWWKWRETIGSMMR